MSIAMMLQQQEKNGMIPSIPILTLTNCIRTHLLVQPNRHTLAERGSCNIDKQLGRLCGAAKALSCLTSSVTRLVHTDAELLNDCHLSKHSLHIYKNDSWNNQVSCSHACTCFLFLNPMIHLVLRQILSLILIGNRTTPTHHGYGSCSVL